MFLFALASSRLFMYSSLVSTGITVQGKFPEASIVFKETLPFFHYRQNKDVYTQKRNAQAQL